MKTRLCPNCNIPLIEDFDREQYDCEMCGFNMTENQMSLDQLYAWVSVDKEGREGLIALRSMSGDNEVVLMSAITASLQNAKLMANMARRACEPVGLNTYCLKFTRERIEDL